MIISLFSTILFFAFSDALKKYLSIYENYPEESYLVLEKIKKSYEKLNKKEDFFDFFKSIVNVRQPLEAFSNIDKNFSSDLSSEEISHIIDNVWYETGIAVVTSMIVTSVLVTFAGKSKG